MLDQIATALAQHGMTGMVAAALLYLLVQKDKELSAEKNARTTDAQNYTKLALELQARVHTSVDRVTELVEQLQKRDSK